MKPNPRPIDILGEQKLKDARVKADRRRIQETFRLSPEESAEDSELQFVVDMLEFQLLDDMDGDRDDRVKTAEEIFQITRTLKRPEKPIAEAVWLLRLGCIGVLGERSADFRRIILDDFPELPLNATDWGERVWASILDVWLRLLRKKGWEDLDAIQAQVVALRESQRELEPGFLKVAEASRDTRPAWLLMTRYHLAKAAEILGKFLGQGSVDETYDILPQLEAQFHRAITAAGRGALIEEENLIRLLSHAAREMVGGSIWTVTRAVNSRVTRFVESITGRDRARPIFEMLPPQRRTLREHGLLGSSDRAVVVSLPTSSGKTFIAQFRMLQALNQFDAEQGWIAYLAPTRALVNQITLRLRRDFSPIRIVVEKVSPALEIDGLEAGMLEEDTDEQFRVLVTTPEKLDLMLRGGWEEKIGRPLTLVVVDEAHGLADRNRGIKLELLLATINRECRYAQFLLLTPFIPNGDEIASWLDAENKNSIEFSVDWTPNDRVVGIVNATTGSKRGATRLEFHPKHTSRNTLATGTHILLRDDRPFGLTKSKLNSALKLAAATAQSLKHRGTIIVLASCPRDTWSIANIFRVEENRDPIADETLTMIREFLVDEMGPDFPLADLLEYRIGVHHGGMSDEVRMIMEWLTEKGYLNVLVATTTIAQGVNFPVSGVVFASYHYRSASPPYRPEMPPSHFWNIAGRAGRVDQGDIGVIAMVAGNVDKLEEYIKRSVSDLNSTLITMVSEITDKEKLLNLGNLRWNPGWSAFIQYLAHTYREIGDHDLFASQVEQVLRGTLGFQKLQKENRGWADQLILGVQNYTEKLKGEPLGLVDATGFSLESVKGTFARIGAAKLTDDMWDTQLFVQKRGALKAMMGVLLKVPELQENLKAVTGGISGGGDRLASIICDWVAGKPLDELAQTYFSENDKGEKKDTTKALTDCCKSIFGKLTQTSSWGLSALQSMMLSEQFEDMSPERQRFLRNLPAKVFYGVDTDEAIALRLLGVPRAAAPKLADHMAIDPAAPLHEIRNRLRSSSKDTWQKALGPKGASYHKVWSIIEGEAMD